MDVQPGNMTICKICKKVFANGKALGGHMKIHYHDSSKETADGHDCGESSQLNNGGGTHGCSVCSKEFPSSKSLRGHMRSHPERAWRGVMEPPGASSSMTGKRAQPEVSPEIPRDVVVAARILLEIGGNGGLVAGGSGENSEPAPNDVVEGPGFDSDKEKMEDPDWVPGMGSGSGRSARILLEIGGNGGFVGGGSGENSEPAPNDVVEGPGSDPDKEKMEDPDWVPCMGSGSGRYKCLNCMKAFASRKALAGHRLKHSREGSRRSRVSDPGPVAGNGSTRGVGGMEQPVEEGSPVEPVRLNQQPWVGSTSSSGGQSEMTQTPEFKLVVDLNFPAEPEDD